MKRGRLWGANGRGSVPRSKRLAWEWSPQGRSQPVRGHSGEVASARDFPSKIGASTADPIVWSGSGSCLRRNSAALPGSDIKFIAMSSTLIGQAPTNLGPLTTTFTPPAACTVAVGAGRGGLAGLFGFGGDEDVAFLGQACSRGKAFDDTACWPETSKGAEKKEAPLSGWGFYSPGLHCPVGYATACSATGGSGGGSGWPVQFKLRDGETAVGCCPRLVFGFSQDEHL